MIFKHRDGRQLSFYYYAFCTQMAKFQESYLQAKTKKIIILAIIDFRYSKKEEVIHSIIFPAVLCLNQMLGGWGRTSVIHGSPDNAKQIRSKAS